MPIELPINWDEVNELLAAGCTGASIAHQYGMHPETLYDRVKAKYGVSFTEHSFKMRQKGDDLIKSTQFKKAVGLSDKGDNTLLIWLGKTRCGQREPDPSANQSKNVTVTIKHDGLGSGTNISTEILPTSSNQGSE